MCYAIYFSTTSPVDLSTIKSEHFQIQVLDAELDVQAPELLGHPYHWYLESKYGGCSCHFRSAPQGLGFGAEVDWYPEDPEYVESTRHFYDTFAEIVRSGHAVDLLTLWNGDEYDKGEIDRIVVELSKVPRDHFRFFEAVHMEVVP